MRLSHRHILIGALGIFWIYCWPGFVGWDTREHFIQARSGIITDAHPAAVAHLVRLVEVFITGPLGLMLIQSVTILLGLYMVLKTRTSERRAAVIASAIFLFPLVSGVTGLITKDALMAGALLIGIAKLLDERTRSQRVGLAWMFAASLMRHNAFTATFAPMVLLFRWRPGITGLRRYLVAFSIWIAVTVGAYALNEALTVKREYFWYWSTAYQDIAGTMQYMDDLDDPTVETMMKGVPLRVHDHIQQRFRDVYNPAYFYQLMRGDTRLLDVPKDDSERAAVRDAWQRFAVAHIGSYLRYRVDTFGYVLGLGGGKTFSNVYIWFTVIAAPETIAELDHDASASKLQARLRQAAVWISLTPLYMPLIYFLLCIALLVASRRYVLDVALVLSGFLYELAYFFLAQTPDIRYSQWMVITSLAGLSLLVVRIRDRSARHGHAATNHLDADTRARANDEPE